MEITVTGILYLKCGDETIGLSCSLRTVYQVRMLNKITTPREFVFQELGISTVFSWCHFANILMKVSVVVVQ